MNRKIRVMIRLGESWSTVGAASLEDDDLTGARMLRLDLVAMSPQLYVPVAGIVGLDDAAEELCRDEAVQVGHA